MWVLLCAGLASCAQEPARELTAAEYARLEGAEQLLIQSCMIRAGFRYQPPAAPDGDARQLSLLLLEDVGWARRNGYGGRIQRGILAARPHDPNRLYRESLAPAQRERYDAALSGGRDTKILSARLPGGGTINNAMGGCRGASKDRLYGDRATWFRLDKIASNLQPLYLPELTKDKQFVAALAAWSACMRGHGHIYASPPEIRAALPGLTANLKPGDAHAAEVKLAVAEATCARSSGLAGTARALQPHYLATAARPYAEELAEHGRMLLAALEKAKKTPEEIAP
ncbi:hypothetical protein [Nonomuraea endophytica]|uniref:Uncharacterized protein n=1 Tax=Nonomuraea endophytica TaxID=714136 RepID=A0A7W8EJR8_9ACTN|nr:hypothetical protein [Nonomuraea endophytica]MBB5080952.1 hypothetical protein [Nonomuraea endophytica]